MRFRQAKKIFTDDLFKRRPRLPLNHPRMVKAMARLLRPSGKRKLSKKNRHRAKGGLIIPVGVGWHSA